MTRQDRIAALKAAVPGDWHAQLDATIADLEQTVAPQPTTVAELHDHMRLRTLQLLAGNETDAYRPIPGASPAQQDFWSKQLFAINAYLNAATQLDEKQRAIAALAPLDDARARLSELASLRIRNLSFVESVDGFGASRMPSACSWASRSAGPVVGLTTKWRVRAASPWCSGSTASYVVGTALVGVGAILIGVGARKLLANLRNVRQCLSQFHTHPSKPAIYAAISQLLCNTK